MVPLKKITTLEHVHSIIRKLFTKSIPNVPLPRRPANFITAWEKNYSGSRNIIYCKGIQNPVCKSPISGENTKLEKSIKRAIFISGTGSFKNGERNHPKSGTHKGNF